MGRFDWFSSRKSHYEHTRYHRVMALVNLANIFTFYVCPFICLHSLLIISNVMQQLTSVLQSFI